MKRVCRPWTGLEIKKLLRFRSRQVPLSFIAYRLGRTLQSVRQKCHNQGSVVQPKDDGTIADSVRLHVGRGKTDAWIALQLGITKYSVLWYRKCQGLKANESRAKRKRTRCIGCNRICPIAAARGWEQLSGWFTRPDPDYPLLSIQSSCPECFRQYGWGDMDAPIAKSHERPRRDDVVQIIAPDEPHVHGYQATVTGTAHWGVFLIVHRPSEITDVPGHIPRWRAMWDEVVAIKRNVIDPRQMGYTGNACPRCSSVRMVRAGACELCEDCGDSTSCG